MSRSAMLLAPTTRAMTRSAWKLPLTRAPACRLLQTSLTAKDANHLAYRRTLIQERLPSIDYIFELNRANNLLKFALKLRDTLWNKELEIIEKEMELIEKSAESGKEVVEKDLQLRSMGFRLLVAYSKLWLSGRVIIEELEQESWFHSRYKTLLLNRWKLWKDVLEEQPELLAVFKPCFKDIEESTQLATDVANIIAGIHEKASNSHHIFTYTRDGTKPILVDAKVYNEQEAGVMEALYNKKGFEVVVMREESSGHSEGEDGGGEKNES
ncbi:hypothetical protein HK104_003044 [Borealophlyctis nickersoniae]|nr:hypothetical protein HK104_003044 [Borealophlyctis nickersoniae]